MLTPTSRRMFDQKSGHRGPAKLYIDLTTTHPNSLISQFTSLFIDFQFSPYILLAFIMLMYQNPFYFHRIESQEKKKIIGSNSELTCNF